MHMGPIVAAPAREKRSSVIIRARISRAGRDDTESRVRNLSATGACIDNDGGLKTGDAVTMCMGTVQDMQAEVVWTRERLAGVRFERTVDLDDARRPRVIRAVPQAGWMGSMDNAYRR